MLCPNRWLALALAVCAFPTVTSAEQVRYRFVPMNACGTMTQVPVGPAGTMGELRRGLGLVPMTFPYVVRPNQYVTFRHPYNGRNTTLPLRLPEGSPRVEQAVGRYIYNYGDYTVEARFNPDGSVDVIYNSGLLRPLPF